ncbi:MAG: roadblock/LC7 domain-containing protein [Candidatus Hodarchaeales archaeon]|jgi:predicted regulator of Ras-like GTPase activity (Roadblock/LC7/MglB family)
MTNADFSMGTSGSNLIEEILERIRQTCPGVSAVALMTRAGLPIEAKGVQVDPALFSAMAATIAAVSEKAVNDLQNGLLEAVILQSDKGYILLVGCGEHAVLATLTDRQDQIGMLFVVTQKIAEDLGDRITEGGLD